jgi:hypothetical protein
LLRFALRPLRADARFDCSVGRCRKDSAGWLALRGGSAQTLASTAKQDSQSSPATSRWGCSDAGHDCSQNLCVAPISGSRFTPLTLRSDACRLSGLSLIEIFTARIEDARQKDIPIDRPLRPVKVGRLQPAIGTGGLPLRPSFAGAPLVLMAWPGVIAFSRSEEGRPSCYLLTFLRC